MDNQKNFIPIYFSNTPEKNENKDIFDFVSQVTILSDVIDSDASIIGIIGDYGSGKSSITEMLEEKRRNKKNKIIRINLWDNNLKSSKKTYNSVFKSFLYQLSYGNSKKNRNFSDYINFRFNKNQGRVSLKLATRKSFFFVGLAAILITLFYTLNCINFDFFYKNGEDGVPFQNNTFLYIAYTLRYLFLILAGSSFFVAVRMAAPIFSSWKSEGKYNIDNSDISDVYTLIIDRLLKKNKKVIVFIDDLDRMATYETVINFLKELYKCINLLSKEQSEKIVFVVSLKPEELLQGGSNSIESIYPKIFDYTLNIKPIHCETYYDVVKDLLLQKKDLLDREFNFFDKDIISKLLKDLCWLYIDEQLTIREIKERLNETFLLYQTLRSRDYKSSSVELKKAAAVIFLKRKFPDFYYDIIANEHNFAVFIRNCFKITDFNQLEEKVEVFVNEIESKQGRNDTSEFIKTVAKILYDNLIEDDFAMYFYNYPKHSYIKTLDEKELFDSLTLNKTDFLEIDKDGSKIQKIIHNKNGFVIKEAFTKFPPEVIPDIVYESESIFRFVIERLPNQKKQIFDEFETDCKVLSKDNTDFLKLLNTVLNYSFSENLYSEIVKATLTQLKKTLKLLGTESEESVIIIRKQIIEVLKSNAYHYSELFISDDLPCIDTEEYQLLKKINIHFSVLKKMSEKRLIEFDKVFVSNLDDKEVEELLIGHNLYESVLFTYAENNQLKSFDFCLSKRTNKIIEILRDLYEQNENSFIAIRFEILRQVQDLFKEINYYQLFELPYPIVNKQELDIIYPVNLYQVVDFERIDDNLITLLIQYANLKLNNENDFYNFMNGLFIYDDDNKIRDKEMIRKIVQGIDFDRINISKLNDDKLEAILNLLTPVFLLNNFSECVDFMKKVKHLIPVLEQQVIAPVVESDLSLLDNYIELINSLNECSGSTFEILKNKNINYPLCPSVTSLFYEKGYFIRYLVGKSLYDKSVVDDNKISIEKYYSAFKMSENFAELFKNRPDLLNQFVQSELYEKDLPDGRLPLFYKLRQPIKLTNFIMRRLNDKPEKMNEYLYSITDFDKIEDAYKFIDLITSDEYVSLLKETDLFWYLWHKMWNKGQKVRFTKLVNRKLNTEYHSSDKEFV